jgi:hypothetical protein
LWLLSALGGGGVRLTAYVAWKALRDGRVCGVVKVAGGVPTEAVLRALAEEAGRILSAGLYFSARAATLHLRDGPTGRDTSQKLSSHM